MWKEVKVPSTITAQKIPEWTFNYWLSEKLNCVSEGSNRLFVYFLFLVTHAIMMPIVWAFSKARLKIVKYAGAEVKKAINPITSLKFSHWSGFVYVTYWPITVKRWFIVTQNSTGNAIGNFGRCSWQPTLCMTTSSWSLTRCVAIYRSGSKDLIPIRLPGQ